MQSGCGCDRRWFGLGRGDLAKNIVEPAALDPQRGDRPAAITSKVGDFGNHRAAIAREDDEPVTLGIADRLDDVFREITTAQPEPPPIAAAA